jgi:hypothetical protein
LKPMNPDALDPHVVAAAAQSMPFRMLDADAYLVQTMNVGSSQRQSASRGQDTQRGARTSATANASGVTDQRQWQAQASMQHNV